MGSLVAGWDAERLGVPPKELQEHPDTFEQESAGYFARLRQKQLGRRSQDLHHATSPTPAAEHPPLRRVSAPYADHPFPIAADTQHNVVGSPPLGSSVPSAYGRIASMPSKGAGAARAPPQVDWAKELTSLKSNKLGPIKSSSMKADRQHEEEAKGHYTWWKKLEAGALNQHPDLPEDLAHARSGGSFIPQFGLSKLAHEEEVEAGGATTVEQHMP